VVIIAFISVFFVVEVSICVKLCVVSVVIMDLTMYWCMRMYVDVNKHHLVFRKIRLLLLKDTHTHTHTQTHVTLNVMCPR